jgi:hypothetical protein
MKYILFLLFLIELIKSSVNASSPAPLSLNPMMIRNTGLRFLISCNYKKCKNTIIHVMNIFEKQINQMYENSQFKYAEYYSMSDDDRTVIETIFGLFI